MTVRGHLEAASMAPSGHNAAIHHIGSVDTDRRHVIQLQSGALSPCPTMARAPRPLRRACAAARALRVGLGGPQLVAAAVQQPVHAVHAASLPAGGTACPPAVWKKSRLSLAAQKRKRQRTRRLRTEAVTPTPLCRVTKIDRSHVERRSHSE